MSTASSLSFYRTSPQESVSLDDFEELGRLRLKLLSRTCAEWSSHTRSKPPNPRMDEVVELREGTDADLLSHYALRLAFCRVTNDWSWFISAESKLFAVRLNNLPPESAVTLLSREGITFELLDRDNFKSVQSQKGIYRVPFTEALQLVNQREVVLHDGYCFVPCRRMNIVAIHHFERSLQDQMTDLQYALPAQGFELERLTPLLDALVKEAHVLSGSESLTTKLSAPQLDVIKIDQVADMHFPLCMKQLHRKLRENHHLKYDGRVQYRLFLKGAGMSVHECIQFFRSEFIKTIPASKFDKEYAYHIRHSYGLEGSRKDYKPLSCEQIISNNAPNHGQYHGCPFKHWDRQALQDEIYRCHVPVRTAMDILQQATSGNFQRACTSFFYATHHRTPLTRLPNCPDSDRTGIAPIMMHPNAYLNFSRRMVVISPADGLPTDLRSLNTRNATPEQLLAILYELRNTVGPKVVNNAIVKVMVTNDYVVQSNECENQKLMKDKKEKHQDTSRKKKIKCKREFNLTNYSMRTVAIKFLYLGENYAGFARQDHMPETVERYLIEALKRSKLIDKIEDAEYSRCGRTDRGVSAFGQVVALRVRSNLPASAQLLTGSSIDDVKPGEKFKVRLATGEEKMVTEIDYASHLNRALPTAIRVYSVASCRSDFSARFDCKARMYRYFFLRRNLDIEKMQVAANELVGKHDFRNFCRIDTNCQVFERKIQSFQIVKCSSHTAEDPRQQMYRCEVFGRAFLWHQVRCMVEVLFLVGSGREEPSIVLQLLDIAHTPRKPQYDMAADLPLVLHDCYFASPDEKESPGPDFWYTPLALLQVHAELTAIWEQRSVQAAMLRSHLDALEEFQVDPQKVVQDLDHYAPKLEQLMQERNLLTTKGTLVRWKEVSPLLSLAKKRKTLPLAKRDTGHSVDECKRKAQERKRRRELEEQIVIEKRELAFNVSS